MSRELRGRGEDGEVGVERLSVEAGHGGQQATHERVIFLVTRLSHRNLIDSYDQLQFTNNIRQLLNQFSME